MFSNPVQHEQIHRRMAVSMFIKVFMTIGSLVGKVFIGNLGNKIKELWIIIVVKKLHIFRKLFCYNSYKFLVVLS